MCGRQELRQALVSDGAATLAGGAAWDAAAEGCAAGAPDAGLDRLLQLWTGLQEVWARISCTICPVAHR